MGDNEPLEQFRAYYTQEKAAGDHDEAIRQSRAETGLYTMLRKAFYAGWRGRGELPTAPVKVPEAVQRAMGVLRTHFEGTGSLIPPVRAAATGTGGGYTHTEEALAPLPLPQQAHWSRPPVHQPAASLSGAGIISSVMPGPPPVTHISDYQAELPQSGPRGACCPTCQSADCDTRLGVWSGTFGENVACPDKWHSGNDRHISVFSSPVKWTGSVTGRMTRPPPAGCPECGSEVASECGLVPGRSGQPVSCTSEWHDVEHIPGHEA